MNQLLYCDALATLYLQQWLYHVPGMETAAVMVTKLGDPRYSYVVIFPLVYWFLGATAGRHVLVTAALSEWCNIVLKWLLLGNRPYWWVWLHTDWPQLLHQTSVTCETGNPSGHVMITLAVLLTCADYVELRPAVATGNSDTKEAHNFLWTNFRCVLWLTMSLIATSRLLISSHFVHQIVCGVVVGLLLHRATSHHRLRSLLSPPPHTHSQWRWLLVMATVMILLGLVLFKVWRWLGMDPGFSIALAERYCADSEWVRLDTTPFFSLMRAAGVVVGVAVMTVLRPTQSTVSQCTGIIGLLVSLAMIGCLEMIPMATDITLFYVQSLCVWAAVPVMVGGVAVIFS